MKCKIVLSRSVKGDSGHKIVVGRPNINFCEGGLSCVENSVED